VTGLNTSQQTLHSYPKKTFIVQISYNLPDNLPGVATPVQKKM